jgi:hypothetical protein
MSARVETVTSPLLSDPPADPKPKVRPVSKDYADTLRDGFVETDVDVWFASLGSRS